MEWQQQTYGPRIDYLKFVVAMDYDRGQRIMANIVVAIHQRNLDLRERENYRITVLGPVAADPDKSRYCVESWGEKAVQLALVVPEFFWDDLNRIDFRQPLLNANSEQVESFISRRAMSKTGARNVTTFNTKNRQKSDSRDVGGRGITFGSRKSDSHTVVYMRAGEQPVLECRFQGSKAASIGANMITRFANNETDNPHDDLLKELAYPVSVELRRSIGVSGVGDLNTVIANDHRHMQRVQQAFDFIAPEEADKYENSTTTEEQERDQMERWLPTSLFNGPRIK